jgi:hypothetical protein
MTLRHYWIWLVAGAVLRLVYPLDIHYASDQSWTLSHALQTWSVWPWLGMPSSAGIPNPGLSLWIFKPFILMGVTTPLALSRCVVWVNLVSLAGLGAWAAHRFPPESSERRVWLFAGALVAVNPLDVFLSRVIWAQSMAPPIALLFWIGFMDRRRWWGAFLWGAAGAMLGQIHMIGFPLALAVWLGALLARSAGAQRFFLIGSAATAWPLWFWLRALPTAADSVQHYSLVQHFPGKVWLWWLAAEGGLGVRYLSTNYWRGSFEEFLAEPRLGLWPSYGMLVALTGLAVLTAAPFAMWLKGLLRRPPLLLPASLAEPSDTGLLLRSSVFVFGLLATLMPTPVFAHYFIVLFPAGSLWIAQMWTAPKSFPNGHRALWAMLILQFAVSATTAFFVHQHFSDPNGGFANFNPIGTIPYAR